MINIFGIRLKELLQIKGLNQKSFCKDTNISQATVSDWINQKQQPTADYIIIVANYFQTSTDYMLGLENEDGSKN